MKVFEVVAFAMRALRGHRLRTVLSLLGMAIGIAAVLVLTALGNGARLYVTDQFNSIGSNLLILLPGRAETTGGTIPGTLGVPNDLTLDDAETLRRHLPRVRRVAPITLNSETVAFQERRRQVAVIGATRAYFTIRQLELAAGSFLPDEEAHRGAPLVVLGSGVARELFDEQNAIGQAVRIGGGRYRVIGVLATSGTQLGVDLDELAVIPVASAMRLFNRSSLFRVLLQTWSYNDLESAQAQATALLAERHGEEDFTCIRQDSVVSGLGSILGTLTLVLVTIAAVSLTVAGIGIMNVMLVSVSERTREVGLLKALGAGRRQILGVFLAEAILLSAAGGLLGLGLGAAAIRVSLHLFPALPASPPTWAIVSALGVSVLTGVAFGVLPARRASELDPITALAGH